MPSAPSMDEIHIPSHPLSPPLSLSSKARAAQQQRRNIPTASKEDEDQDPDTTFRPSSYFDLMNKTTETMYQSLRPSKTPRIATLTSPASPDEYPSNEGPSWDGSVRGLSSSRRPITTSLAIPSSASTSRSFSSSPSSLSSSSRLPPLPSSSKTTATATNGGRPSPPLPTPLQNSASSSSSSSSPKIYQLPKVPTTPTQTTHRQASNARASSSSPATTTFSSHLPPSRRKKRKPPLILSREEERALAARYDLLSSDELASALAPWGPPEEEGDLFGRSRAKKKSSSSSREDVDEGDRPLFPPSPPGSPGGGKEHPLKILARVGWKLWRHQLEDEEEEDEGEGDAMTDEPGHVQDATLHSDLFEALSTSLETTSSAFLNVQAPPRNHFLSSSPRNASLPLSSAVSLPLPNATGSSSTSSTHDPHRDKARQGSISTLASFVSNGSVSSSVVSSTLQDGAPTPVVKSRASSLRNEAATGSLPMKNGGGKKPLKTEKKRDRATGGSIGDWMWGWGGGSSTSSSVAGSDSGVKDVPKRSLRGFLSPPLLSPAITTVEGTSYPVTSSSSPLTSALSSSPFPAASYSSVTSPTSFHATLHSIDEPSSSSATPTTTPSHFRAIFLSTRLISSNPASLLSDSSSVSPLVSNLAFDLISNARDAKITIQELPSARRGSSEGRKARSPAPSGSTTASTTSLSLPTSTSTSSSAKASTSTEKPLAAASSVLSRVLNSATLASSGSSSKSRLHPSNLVISARQVPPPAELGPKTPGTALIGGSYPFPSNGTNGQAAAGGGGAMPSVELESIEPLESKPPTVLFDRAGYLKGFFGAKKIGEGSTREKRASRFEKSGEALTDRYGFIYDVTSIKMLRDASEAGAPAPATFSGLNNHNSDESDTDDEEDWVERNVQFIQESPSKMGLVNGGGFAKLAVHDESDEHDHGSQDLRASLSSSSGVSVVSSDVVDRHLGPNDPSTPTSPTARGSRLRSSTLVSLNPSPVRPIISPQTFHVSADAPSLDNDAVPLPGRGHGPNPISLTGRKTIQILLNQLTDIHDSQQSARKASWDSFLRRRRDSLALTSSNTGDDAGFVGFAQMGLGGKAGKEDLKEFVKLVREGIPIAYRAKVWAECSGASDVMAPGEYEDLLAKAEEEGVDSTVRNEIEKDVVRTLPLNVFFGGDGPGVSKLRKILTAFAWHDMTVGYCQGLNMVAATLLLTHQREEEAFWVFLCVVERLMPPNYYSPDLLCSRADQRVLQDFVQQELPALDRHMAEHGIEITAVAFGWFLSLFTDCLPVETLFRTWDVFFVEGFDTFFRIALAILKINEKDLLEADSTSNLYQHLGGCASRLWNADQLLAIENDLKATVTHDAITSRRAFHVSALVEEMGSNRPY